jgi:hypothetical protein
MISFFELWFLEMDFSVLTGWTTYHLLNGKYDNVLAKLKTMSFVDIVKLEASCDTILANVMQEQNWWESLFASRFPLTYVRYQHHTFRSNAISFQNTKTNQTNQKNQTNQTIKSAVNYRLLWESILQKQTMITKPFQLQVVIPKNEEGIEHLPRNSNVSTLLSDEFGLGAIFAVQPRGFIRGRCTLKKEKEIEWTGKLGEHGTQRNSVLQNLGPFHFRDYSCCKKGEKKEKK